MEGKFFWIVLTHNSCVLLQELKPYSCFGHQGGIVEGKTLIVSVGGLVTAVFYFRS